MPVNRLRNIDEIVNQDGTTVVIEDLANGTGGSGGTVSASGLAISRSEDSQYIDYAFNEGATSSLADGHSYDPANVIFGSGRNNSGMRLTSDMKSFSSDSVAAGHGDLTAGRYLLSGGSDGTKAIFAGGFTGSNLQTLEYQTFASSADALPYGSLNEAKHGMGAANDGTQTLFAGGHTGSGWASNYELVQFASQGSQSVAGGLSHPRHALAGTSNGTVAMFAGGADNSTSGVTNVCDIVSFSSISQAVSHGTLSVERSALTSGSNNSIALFTSGGTSEHKSFDSAAHTNTHTALLKNNAYRSSASNGTSLMTGAGFSGSGDAGITDCEIMSIEGSEVAKTHGNLSEDRYGPAAVSGGTA